MKNAQVSPAELARVVGVADSIISRWLKGAIPTVKNLRKAAPVLGVPVRDLVVRAGHMLPEEVGLEAPPTPPEPYRRAATVQDDIKADPDLSDGDKRLMIDLYERLLAQVKADGK